MRELPGVCWGLGKLCNYAKFQGTGEQEQSAQEWVNSEDPPPCKRSLRQFGITAVSWMKGRTQAPRNYSEFLLNKGQPGSRDCQKLHKTVSGSELWLLSSPASPINVFSEIPFPSHISIREMLSSPSRSLQDLSWVLWAALLSPPLSRIQISLSCCQPAESHPLCPHPETPELPSPSPGDEGTRRNGLGQEGMAWDKSE